jgi:hypothetical protein
VIAQPVPPVNEGSSAKSLDQQKEVEFYAATVNGWVATRMEFDKTVISLSAAGLALFVTLLTAVGVHSRWEAVFYVVGSIGFFGTIGVGLRIFIENAKFLEALLQKNDQASEGDRSLDRLDKWIVRLFGIGAIGAMLAGASAAFSRYHS